MPEIHVIDEKPMSMTLLVTDIEHSAPEIIKSFLRSVDKETLIGEALTIDPENAPNGLIVRLCQLADQWGTQ